MSLDGDLIELAWNSGALSLRNPSNGRSRLVGSAVRGHSRLTAIWNDNHAVKHRARTARDRSSLTGQLFSAWKSKLRSAPEPRDRVSAESKPGGAIRRKFQSNPSVHEARSQVVTRAASFEHKRARKYTALGCVELGAVRY